MRSLIADLGDAYCVELRRTRIGPFASRTPTPSAFMPLDEALAFLPARRAGRRATRAAPPTAWRVPARPDGPSVVRLRDADGPVASPSRARTALLKPVVGFRGMKDHAWLPDAEHRARAGVAVGSSTASTSATAR